MSKTLLVTAQKVFSFRVVFLAFGFINRLLLARFLGEAGLGSYQYLIAWIDVLLILTVFGLDRFLVREIAVFKAKSEFSSIRGVLQFGNYLSMILTLTVMGSAIIVYACRNVLSLRSTLSSIGLTVFIIILLLLLLKTILRIQQSALQGFGYISEGQSVEYLLQPILFFFFLLLGSFLFGDSLSYIDALIITLIVFFFTAIASIYQLWHYIPSQIRQVKPKFQIRSWVVASVPLVLLSSIGVIYSRADIILLGILDTNEAVGIYSTAVQIATPLALILIVGNTILAPDFSRLYHENKQAELQQLVTSSTIIMAGTAIIVGIGLFVFGESILGIFGEGFKQGVLALKIILLGQIFNILTGSVGHILTMTKYAWEVAIVNGLTAILNIALNIIWIPKYGMEGAAFATLVTILIWNTILTYFVWKKLGIIPTAIGILLK